MIAPIVLASAVVRGTFELDVPADILERLASRVDEERFHSRAEIRTHEIASPVAERKLHVVALETKHEARLFEDVRFELDGRRLHYEVRFPKLRRTAFALWALAIVGPVIPALVLYAFVIPSRPPWSMSIWLGAVAFGAVFTWLFTAIFVHGRRETIRQDMRRIIGEAIGGR